MSTPKYLQEEEALSEEYKDLISSLPTEKGWLSSQMYLYKDFWYDSANLQPIFSCQNHFQAQNSDILLVTNPKSGTTWFKAIIFTLINRKKYPINKNHPLLTNNPHELAPSLEYDIYGHNQILDVSSFPSPRFFATHIPYVSLPASIKNSSTCKIVYVCRNIKDTFVSLWHFMNKVRVQEKGNKSIEEYFGMFCEGLSIYGPFWDHVLQYWRKSKEESDRVLFVKYEDMKEDAAVNLRRLAAFLGCPFSADEEGSDLVEQILMFTSFERMSSLDVNKNGVLPNGVKIEHFFRRGEVGDWKNYLTGEMVEKLDGIINDKFSGSGLML